MNSGEPSAQDCTANGGRGWRGHDDGLGGGTPTSSCVVLRLTERGQPAQADAVRLEEGSGVATVVNG